MIINKLDNVEINLDNGHKYALCDIAEGENIIKYEKVCLLFLRIS